MSAFSLYVLGTFHMTCHGKPVVDFRSDKARGLLAYLALEAGHPHRREELAALFWPDMSEGAARRNLRLTLHRVRKALGDEVASLFFENTRDVILCRPDVIWVDALAFERCLLAVRRHEHRPAMVCASCADGLSRAVELYRGDFLRGLFVQGSLAFAEWVTLKRERWHRMAVEALFALTEYCRRRGLLDQAHRYARRQIELEPWREEAHRQLMDILARQGQISAALAHYEACCRMLAREFGVGPDEETRALYRRILRLRRRRRLFLPPQATPFVGRRDELAWLADRLSDPDCRLISIVGLAGVGKTRLALEAAAAHAFAFLHGVCVVSLRGVREMGQFTALLGDRLGVSGRDTQPSGERIVRFLRGRELLLVLDNAEQMMASETSRRALVDFLLRAMRACPGLKVVITSRRPVNVQAEWVLRLEGLPYPSQGVNPAADGGREAVAFPAVRLFVARAQQARWNFDPEQELADVVQICRLVEGMPLGIELAAAWTRTLSCREIAARLRTCLDELESPLDDVEPHHRNLWAALESSWRLLEAPLQRALAQLATFPADFSADAAYQVAQVSPALLTALVERALLRRPQPGRYELHELLRTFAWQKLNAMSQSGADTLLQRHARYYMAFLQGREEALRGKRQAEALRATRGELKNVIVAWRWALAHGDVVSLERACDAIYLTCEMCGRFHHGEALFREAAEQIGTVEESSPSVSVRLRAKLLLRHGWFLWRLGQYARARRVLRKGFALARRQQDEGEMAFALGALGIVAHNTGQYETARRLYRQSLALFRRIGDVWSTVRVLSRCGLLAYTLGELEQAKVLFEEASLLAGSIGDLRGEAFTLAYLGLVARELGNALEACRRCESALAYCREVDDEYGIALCLAYLGRALGESGAHERALNALHEALDRFRELGDGHAVAYTLGQLGEVCRLRGDHAAARQWHRESLAAYRELNSYGGMAEALGHLAYLAFRQGDDDRARQLFQQCLELVADEEHRVALFTRRWGEAMRAVGCEVGERGDGKRTPSAAVRVRSP